MIAPTAKRTRSLVGASHDARSILALSTPNWTARSAILLVDDDPFMAYARKAALERRFRAVERAADAAQAFILLEDRAFTDRLALIIVALCQPGFSGPAFVRELTD